jgi:TP901 family phage tail tape measure protein
MAKGFNLTAELNIRGPNNLRTVVSNIKKQVGSITANITPTVNRSNIRTIATDIRSQLGNINVAVGVTANRSSIQNLSRDIRNRLSGIDVPVSVRINRASITAARRDITRQLGSINANVNIAISATATRNAAGLNRTLTGLNQTLNQTTTSATNAAAAIQSFAAAMRGAASVNIPRNINIGLNTANTNATNAAASVQQLGGEVENFGRQAGLAIRRFAAFTTVTSVFYGLARAVQSGITSFIDFDRELVRISQVTGDNIRDVNKLASTVTQLATTYGVSSKELAGVSLTLAQAGLTAKETDRALKALALSALAPSFDDLNSTVEGSIALMRQFGISTNQLEGALGSINSVAAKFAVEASDIIAAIQRTGGVFAAASKGVSEGTDALNEFVAVFTSIRATTRESAETIATGLRTIFTRIQRGPTIEALKQFGVNLTDVEGKFVGAYKAVQLLSEGLTRLDPRDLRFSQIVEELGGFRQIGKVIPLIQEFATAQEALKVAQTGSGSLAEDAAKGQLALAVQISKVREEFAALIRSVGDTSSFRTLVKLGLDLASSLIQVADAAKELLPLIGIFTAIRGAQALTRFGAGFAQGVRGAPTRGFASGGYVPGVGNSDTVPAMLTPGEFVIRKKAVQKIGVGNLAKINRNSGGYIPEQYFNDGGQVQRFGIGGGAKKKGVNWKSLIKGRGKKGSRGPRGRFDLPQPGDADFAKWQREIYAEYDADPSLTRVKVNGIPMPPEIAYANQLITEEVFGDNVRKKSGKLKKTPLGLLISAAKMPRGPRAPAGEMEKIMAGYQQSPQFQKEAGGAGSSLFATLKGPLASFKKGGTFGGVITPGSDNATQIKAALGKLLTQSSGQDAVKAKTALDKFDSFIAG